MHELDYTAIGSRIRQYRKSQHLTQEKLAEKIQISTTHMSHIETADTKLSLQVLADLSTALGVSADALIFGTESSDTKTALLQSISDRFSRLSERQARFVTDNVIYQIDILSREDLT